VSVPLTQWRFSIFKRKSVTITKRRNTEEINLENLLRTGRRPKRSLGRKADKAVDSVRQGLWGKKHQLIRPVVSQIRAQRA
jgi:hypothetical protein